MDVSLEKKFLTLKFLSINNIPESLKTPRHNPGHLHKQAYSGEAFSRTTTRKILLQNIFVNLT